MIEVVTFLTIAVAICIPTIFLYVDRTNNLKSALSQQDSALKKQDKELKDNEYIISELTKELSLFQKVTKTEFSTINNESDIESFDYSVDYLLKKAKELDKLKYFELSYLLYEELNMLEPLNIDILKRLITLSKKFKMYQQEREYILKAFQSVVFTGVKDHSFKVELMGRIQSYLNSDSNKEEILNSMWLNERIGNFQTVSDILGLISQYYQCCGNLYKYGYNEDERKVDFQLSAEMEMKFSTDFNIKESIISELNERIALLQLKYDNLRKENEELKSKEDNIATNHRVVNSGDIEGELKKKIERLNEEIDEKTNQIIELDNQILLQEYGIYSPVYDFANSELYKTRLESIRYQQKRMITNGTAAKCSQIWTLNGSVSKGRLMTEQNIKQVIRCFNDECDVLVSKVKFNNVSAFIDKMKKSADILNKMNLQNAIEITEEYISLKIEELQLAYEYAVKKQEEKEEQKRIREQMREDAKLLKEIEESRREIEKEQHHYTNALIKINRQMENCSDTEREVLIERKAEIEGHLEELNVALKDIDYREANKKAGYVYIISNIGSFGENVYKIGMTRRLDPMERVDELGDASVPFKFDVHAMIFSDDAPKLETALHHAFENKKVNMVNGRREFFNVTLDEIEDVVKRNFDKTVEFTRVPQAEQYRESVRLRRIK